MPSDTDCPPIPMTPELRAVAKRVVWFQSSRMTLEQPRQFLTYLMTYGTLEDVAAVLNAIGEEPFVATLDNPLPGIFDGRSWRFWHLKLKGRRAPPLPRRFPEAGSLNFPGK
jgi:hypothetical protein